MALSQVRKEIMERELLLFQLGPVQEFIAQAETIGDLRVGSELLSELTAAALETVPAYEMTCVFPAVEKGHLEGIPNRFLACVPKGEGEALAKRAADAAQAKLMAIAEGCWPKLKGVPQTRHEAYLAQVKAFLQTTWVVLKTPSGGMGADYGTIGKLMALRRNTRAFDAWHGRSLGRRQGLPLRQGGGVGCRRQQVLQQEQRPWCDESHQEGAHDG